MTGRSGALLGVTPSLAVAVIVAAAVLSGGVLFVLTSLHEPYTISGPVCQDRTLVEPGFDLWTGMPHGVIVTCPQFDSAPNEGTLPPDLVGRRAVPLPVGGLIGAGLALLFLAAVNRRRAPDVSRPSRDIR
jgi:hypothetical protein